MNLFIPWREFQDKPEIGEMDPKNSLVLLEKNEAFKRTAVQAAQRNTTR